ncbi:hypothetical protein NIES4103_50980 [Nostoc sp. NIES-4103]|nr:hypothetical protein NIES4103_50980 [Nostoc sp. NIES-4103]
MSGYIQHAHAFYINSFSFFYQSSQEEVMDSEWGDEGDEGDEGMGRWGTLGIGKMFL